MKKRYLLLIVLLIISMWGSTWYFIPLWYPKETLEAGTFGDMFGAVNALFSGLAFAGLIYTITVQRQELALQREAITMQTEELRMQREETARSVDQMEGQSQMLRFQLTMTTVNELVKSKNKRIEAVRFIHKGEEHHGVEGLIKMVHHSQMSKEEKAIYFDYYLNSFFYILQYILNSDLTAEQKESLMQLLDTDTSDHEISVLYEVYNHDQHRLLLMRRFNLDRRVPNTKVYSG
ncbi:hypothetical protein MKX40_17945 [Paenibacillus sp. FSL R5-0517]|uniref:hypothetical protein n=1 Tax=Paenibacillus sp. FSL R5-0517 TaxID=2921647 RepID=UPI0030DDDB00